MNVKNLKELANEIGCPDHTIGSISRSISKGTDCGAFVESIRGGVRVGSIVEGCDIQTSNHDLQFPFSMDTFWQATKKVEVEANFIWNQTHGCSECWVGEFPGYTAINPDCPSCHGNGVVL